MTKLIGYTKGDLKLERIFHSPDFYSLQGKNGSLKVLAELFGGNMLLKCSFSITSGRVTGIEPATRAMSIEVPVGRYLIKTTISSSK